MSRDRRDVLGTLASNMAATRHARGWTQARLAALAGVELESLRNVERARYNTTIVILVRLAEALGSSLDALLRPARQPARDASKQATCPSKTLRPSTLDSPSPATSAYP